MANQNGDLVSVYCQEGLIQATITKISGTDITVKPKTGDFESASLVIAGADIIENMTQRYRDNLDYLKTESLSRLRTEKWGTLVDDMKKKFPGLTTILLASLKSGVDTEIEAMNTNLGNNSSDLPISQVTVVAK